MTASEYDEYAKRVGDFFADWLQNLSAIPDDDGNVEPFFSWRRCDVCRTSLGGDRYHCNGYNGRTGEVEEYDYVCADCVYFAEYGRLDDTTMAEVEADRASKASA